MLWSSWAWIWLAALAHVATALLAKPPTLLQPGRFRTGERVPVYATTLSSLEHRQALDLFSVPWLPVPEGGLGKHELWLSEFLHGKYALPTGFDVYMGENSECKVLGAVDYSRRGLDALRRLIADQYVAEFMIDGFPSASTIISIDTARTYFLRGFPIGEMGPGGVFLYDHFTFVIRHRPVPGADGLHELLTFQLFPKSTNAPPLQCPHNVSQIDPSEPRLRISTDPYHSDLPEQGEQVTYTYSVYFIEDTGVTRDTRLDNFYYNVDILLDGPSIVATLLFWCLVAASGITYLAVQIYKGNEGMRRALAITPASEAFSSAAYGGLLTSIVGAGVQAMFLIPGTTALALTKMVDARDNLERVAIAFFCLAGFGAGFTSAMLYKSMDGLNWKHNAFLAFALLPSHLLCAVFVLNVFVWIESSQFAIPNSMLMSAVVPWTALTAPLHYLGAFMAYKYTSTRPEQLPRTLDGSKLMTPPRGMPRGMILRHVAFCAVVPFLAGAFCIHTIMKSLYVEIDNGFNKLVAFTAASLGIMALQVIMVCSLSTYYCFRRAYVRQWPWFSLACGMSCSGLCFLYTLIYSYTHVRVGGVFAACWYANLIIILWVCVSIASGSVGYISARCTAKCIYRYMS